MIRVELVGVLYEVYPVGSAYEESAGQESLAAEEA